MVDENTVKISLEAGETEVIVTDGEGGEHDISPAFRGIAGSTPQGGGASSTLTAQMLDGTATTVTWTATTKELKFSVGAGTLAQLLALEEAAP